MTRRDEPVDIFDREDFSDPATWPPTPVPGRGRRASRGDGGRPRLPWVFGLVGVAMGLVISWVVLNQGVQPRLPADHPPTDAALATPTPLTPEELAALKAAVDANPASTEARLIYGVALFNEGRLDEAKEQWLEVTRLDPTDPGPWYNLGFLHLSLEPPAVDEAEAAWRTVIELAPGTSMAETAGQHIARLNSTARPVSTPSPTTRG